MLAGTDPATVRSLALEILRGKAPESSIPDLWDGHAAGRIVDVLAQQMGRVADC